MSGNHVNSRSLPPPPKSDSTDLSYFKYLVPNRAVSPPSNWDWSAALNALFTQSTTRHLTIPEGTYLINSPLTITVNNKFVSAYGAKFVLGTGVFIKFLNSAGITIEGMELDGNNFANNHVGFALEACTDFYFFRCNIHHVQRNAFNMNYASFNNNITIDSCEINDIGSVGLTITTQGMALYTHRVNRLTVLRCNIRRTRGQSAIYLQRADVVNIVDSLIEDTWYRGIQTFNNTNPTADDVTTNLKIRGNTIRRTGSQNTTSDGTATNGIFCRNDAGKASDIIITDNTIDTVGENCIEGRFTAKGNTLLNSGAYPSLTTPSKEMVYMSSDSVFSNNTLENSTNELIKIFGSRANLSVTNNLLINPGTYGITIQADGAGANLDGVDVSGNTIVDKLGRALKGLRLVVSNGGTITGKTTVANNKTLGIAGGNLYAGTPTKYNNSSNGVIDA